MIPLPLLRYCGKTNNHPPIGAGVNMKDFTDLVEIECKAQPAQLRNNHGDMCRKVGVSIVMGDPQNGWFYKGKIPLTWMIWGYPYVRKPP